MINHAMYKTCLFLTAGNVERQAGTTSLQKLGGLARNMPLTFLCFIIAAASISGFPLTNGFYSKELVYESALRTHPIFYIAAVLGTVLTAASFLKLGHAAFLGRRDAANDNVREAPATMLLPAGILAAGCLVFGLGNALPLRQLILPGLGLLHEGESFVHVLPENSIGWWLTLGTVAALTIAFLNHVFGVKRSGSGLGAVDHIHHAPVLATIYTQAEAGRLDPYRWGMGLAQAFAYIGNAVDWINDQIFESLAVGLTALFSWSFRKMNTGSYALYVLWCLAGAAAVIWWFLLV
jgi:NADH-quinone oxidoreductase subunit L